MRQSGGQTPVPPPPVERSRRPLGSSFSLAKFRVISCHVGQDSKDFHRTVVPYTRAELT